MSRLIDVMHQGRERVIGAWEVDGMVVDPGPEPCIEKLLEGLGGEPPRALLLTHIHLDHAGAAGALVRRFPELRVYVHELGAPHLVDPSKLLASAERLYGADMQRLWGEVVPVPERNLRSLRGGESTEGFEVVYTPGHASHHVAYVDARSGECFAGDVAGVRIPPSELVIAPMPPPELDLEAWERSLDELEGRAIERLCLTHFGATDEVGEQLWRVRESLRRWSELARTADRERLVEALRRAVDRNTDAEGAARYELALPPEHVWLGLERYWRKRGVFAGGVRKAG